MTRKDANAKGAKSVVESAWDESALNTAQREQLARIMDECLIAMEKGETVNTEAICTKHPELASGIRHYLEGLEFVHEAAAGFRPGEVRQPNSDAKDVPGQLGNYRLLREIGRGGMGVVYEAEDILLNRQVAVKVLPFAALLDQKQIVRFQNEARSAGQLHHPHIVPVYSVGTDRGIHYFAMQFIGGQSLRTLLDTLAPKTDAQATTQHFRAQSPAGAPTVISAQAPDAGVRPPISDTAHATVMDETERQSTVGQASLSTAAVQHRDQIRSVVRIAADVARALDHAHSRGIIHRDIKPANLLLDDAGKIWVTDFGLARAPQESGVTLSGDIMGTVRYMSPEQAAGKSAYVDHRTDIYSLGITLYELLTLKPAFGTSNRQQFLRDIATVDPPRPRTLNRAIPIDLENVVLKATAKEPGTRYETAEEFEADLRRYLDGKPTLAKRPSAFDRAAKWTRRHSKLVAASLLMMAIMLAGSIVATLKIATEQNSTARALVEARLAKEELGDQLKRARAAFDNLLQLNEQLNDVPGTESHQQAALELALEFQAERAANVDAEDPDTLLGVAVASMKAGDIKRQLGDQSQALDYFNQSIDIFERLSQQRPHDGLLHGHAARARNNRGMLLTEMGEIDLASVDLDAAIAAHSAKATPTDPTVAEQALDDLSSAYINRANLHLRLQRRDEARRDFVSATGTVTELLKITPQSPRYRLRLATLYQNLASYSAKARPQVAEEYWRDALAINAALVEEDPRSMQALRNLATAENSFGKFLQQQGELDQAETLHLQALRRNKELSSRAPLVAAYHLELGETYWLLADIDRLRSEFDAAEANYEKSQIEFSWVVERMPNSARAHSTLGGILFNRGILRSRTDRQAGKQLCAQGIEHQAIAVQLAPQLDNYRRFLDHQRNEFHRTFSES